MNRQQIVELLKRHIGDGYGAQSAFARKIQIAPQHLSNVLSGHIELIPSQILMELGYCPVIEYIKDKNSEWNGWPRGRRAKPSRKESARPGDAA